MTTPVQAAEAAVSRAFREEWGQIVSTLIRVTGDWDLAEECAQDAFTAALERWPRDGVPGRPGAWLTTTARNRAIDRLRRETVGAAKLREAVASGRPGFATGEGSGTGPSQWLCDGNRGSGAHPRAHTVASPHPGSDPDSDPIGVSGVRDDLLRLMFTCCHPALALEAQVALTLRTLAGLTTAEIARAFLVSPATMSKRLGRAKGKIRNAGIPYRIPPAHQLPERTRAVLGVLYLLFNEGYASAAGSEPIRRSLCDESIRLARSLARLMPDEPETTGLLALMLLTDGRREARFGDDGALITLEEQDRRRWDSEQIAEGLRLLDAALRRGRPGPYQVQAAIAACHSGSAEAAQTDWPQIAALYGALIRMTPSPVIELNRAVAIGMAEGPAAGLSLLDKLEQAGDLDGYHLLPAARADLFRRMGRYDEAAEAYRRALALAVNDTERRYLSGRLAEVAAGT